MNKSLLCLVLSETTLEKNKNILDTYRNFIDMVELRADYLTQREYAGIKDFPENIGIPAILTVRRASDGGRFRGRESDRRALLKQSLGSAYSYIDLETDFRDSEFEQRLKQSRIRIIRSFHDFDGVPANLAERIREMAGAEGEIPKAAVMPKSTKDLLTLLQCYKKLEDTEKILVGMGDFGFPTRILSNYLGSFLSYCARTGSQAAPGNKDPEEMVKLYGFHKIDNTTKIYGIIGNPIMHSFSPRIHNRGFKALEYNGVYLPFQVDNVGQFFKIAKLLDINGFSVTIPHKQAVIRYLHGKHENINKIKACNTVIKKDGGYYGENTDV
ncbi:MAG: type I 3-dehydroquinate dehydratase, partial [Spirochaetia bacterium]